MLNKHLLTKGFLSWVVLMWLSVYSCPAWDSLNDWVFLRAGNAGSVLCFSVRISSIYDQPQQNLAGKYRLWQGSPPVFLNFQYRGDPYGFVAGFCAFISCRLQLSGASWLPRHTLVVLIPRLLTRKRDLIQYCHQITHLQSAVLWMIQSDIACNWRSVET